MRTILLFTFLFLIVNALMAQTIMNASSKEMPSWYNMPPMSQYYIYYVGTGDNDTLKRAQEQAATDILQQLSSEGKFSLELETQTTLRKQILEQGNSENIIQNIEIQGSMKSTHEKVTIKNLVRVEEYWHLTQTNGRARYVYKILMRRPRPEYEGKTIKEASYGAAPVWRSVVFAGWGQLYKKERGKGISLLTGEAVMLAGSIVSYSMYSMYNNKAGDANVSAANQKVFLDNADLWFNVRNICLVGASAVYLYSLIDAMTAGGAKLYTLQTRKMQVNPWVAQNSMGVSLAFKF